MDDGNGAVAVGLLRRGGVGGGRGDDGVGHVEPDAGRFGTPGEVVRERAGADGGPPGRDAGVGDRDEGHRPALRAGERGGMEMDGRGPFTLGQAAELGDGAGQIGWAVGGPIQGEAGFDQA